MLILAAATTLVLAAIFVDFAMGQRQLRALADIPPADGGPSVSIVAAARNEARGIEAAVRSLLRLDYPALEVVIVNDRSTDDTGTILDRIAGERARMAPSGPTLKIVGVNALAEGWLGKNYALHVGAAHASGDLLLFTDADVVFEPTTLRRAVALMESERIDHLAAIPDIRVPGIALNAFVAAFGVFFSIFSRPWKARDPRSRAHIGIGAFNLIRTSVYRAIGGHGSIAMRPDDDIKLGKAVKKRGFHQDAVLAQRLISVEWYSSLGELVDGLMKNAFAGVDYSLWKVAGSTAALLIVHVLPFVAIFTTTGATRALYATSVALIVLIFWTLNRHRVAYVLAYPAAALLFGYIMWRSALLAVATGTVSWRGTAYPLEAMRRNRV